MSNTAEKKVAVITGASSGIGWAVALRASRKGYKVVLNARREDRLHDLASKIKAGGGDVLVVVGDISRLEDQKRLVAETVSTFGRLDVLVNNAGLPLPTLFSESPPEELRRQWDVNVTALSTLTRIALPYLRESGGTVINIGSSISRFAVPSMGNYAPTKIAVAGLNDALRRELAPQGVKVCLVEPGPINTEFGEHSGSGFNNSAVLSISISAADAAVPIVRLFTHPRRRTVIPAWLGPILTLLGGLTRIATPLVDVAFSSVAGRMQSKE